MKWWGSVFLVVVGVSCLGVGLSNLRPQLPAGRSQTPAPPTQKLPDGPRIQVNRRSVNEGNVASFEEGQTEFVLQNIGEKPLRVQLEQPNCLCAGLEIRPFDETSSPLTSVSSDKEKSPRSDPKDEDALAKEVDEGIDYTPKLLKPGERARLVVRWHTRDRMGPFMVRAPLLTNDPLQPEIEFTVQLNILAELAVVPNLLNLGVVGESQAFVGEVEVLSSTSDQLRVEKITLDDPNLKVEQAPLSESTKLRHEAKSGVRLLIRPKALLPVGRLATKLNLTVSVGDVQASDAERHRHARKIDVLGVVRGSITTKPERAVMGVLRPGDVVTKKVELHGQKSLEKLAVAKVDPFNISAKLAPAKQPKDSTSPSLTNSPNVRVLMVEARYDGQPGPFYGTVLLKDDTGRVVVALPVHGVLAPGASPSKPPTLGDADQDGSKNSSNAPKN